jgi:acetyl esterase/lipase
MSGELTGASQRLSYGEHPLQFGDFRVGRSPARRHTVVVIVHGGFWRSRRTLRMCDPIARDLGDRGWSTWNIEYRRIGQGDWRATLEDCAAAFDHVPHLARAFAVDATRVLALGHSAGGHLAVWCAGRGAAARRSGSRAPAVGVDAAVSLAGVLDLVQAARTHVGDGAAVEFLGAGPDEDPRAYGQADPSARLPIGIPVRCVHSRDDERVPFEQSARYVEAARRAGDDAALVEVGGAHIDPIDVGTAAWQTTVDLVEELDSPRAAT